MEHNIEKSTLKVLYNIAISIGKSLELHKMLRTALKTYTEQLNCSRALLFKIDKLTSTNVNLTLNFTTPLTVHIKPEYQYTLFPNTIKMVLLFLLYERFLFLHLQYIKSLSS